VIVKVYVPAAVVVAVVTESVELPPAVTLVGLNVPLAPEGRPETEKVTVCGVPEAVVVTL
jgi:hypothetical protein